MSSSNNASFHSCYDSSRCRTCSFVDVSGYPSLYYANSMDYPYNPNDGNFFEYQSGAKYHFPVSSSTSYPGSFDDGGLYYPGVQYSSSFQYPGVVSLHPDYYSSNPSSSYWTKQQHIQQQHQHQQSSSSSVVGGSTMSSSSYNIGGSSTNNSDPLNALQNLTVSAGQPAQVLGQQQDNISNRLSSASMYHNQQHSSSGGGAPLVVRPRSSLGSLNVVQRMTTPTDKYPSDAANTQVRSSSQPFVPHQISQVQQNMSSSVSGLSTNMPMTRLPIKNIHIKGDISLSHSPSLSSSMSTPHSLDSSGTPMSAQQPSFHKPSSNNVYQNSPFSSSSSSQSHHLAQSIPVSKTASSPASSSVPQYIDIPKPTSSSSLPGPSALGRPPVNISEEEIKRVAEEIRRLREKYLKSLKLIMENPKKYPDEEMKVLKVLRNILENPDAISKPLSMKHVIKIEQHLVKAEQLLVHDLRAHELGSSLPGSGSSSGQHSVASKALTSGRKTLLPSENLSIQRNTCRGKLMEDVSDSRTVNSLDLAFDEVCHQLMSTDPVVLKKVQKGLVKYVESKRNMYPHLVPKRHMSEDSEDDDCKTISSSSSFKRQRMNSMYDEEEFNYLDNITSDSINDCNLSRREDDPRKYHEGANEYTLDEELDILRKEFDVEEIQELETLPSKNWVTLDTDWSESIFYSIIFKTQVSVSHDIPPLKVRVPGDYQLCRYVDWNINEKIYDLHSDPFLDLVLKYLKEEYSKVNQYLQWSGISIIYVANIYKACILKAKSKCADGENSDFKVSARR